MAGMSVLVLIGALGILFIIFVIFNVIVLTFIILAIVFGVIRAVKKKFKKTFIVFLILAIIFTILDIAAICGIYGIISNSNSDESEELYAIRENDYEKIKEYLEDGWNPNENTETIYYAIKYNSDENKENDNWELLELLLENGANPDVQIFPEPTGVNTPLTYSVECGYYGATELLINYGADVNYKENRFGYTPLQAVRYWDNDKAAETVKLLLDNGADLSLEDEMGESGLDELNDFEKDYKKYKDNVPDYDEMMEIIAEIKD